MQVESVRDNAVAQAKLHAEAEKKEVRKSYSAHILETVFHRVALQFRKYQMLIKHVYMVMGIYRCCVNQTYLCVAKPVLCYKKQYRRVYAFFRTPRTPMLCCNIQFAIQLFAISPLSTLFWPIVYNDSIAIDLIKWLQSFGGFYIL